MSHESDTIKMPAVCERGRFTYFPVVPGRVEFAIEVRRDILSERPQMVAVELPGTLAERLSAALARLPEMSVILYTDDGRGRDARFMCRWSPPIRSPKRSARRHGNRRGGDVPRTRFRTSVRTCRILIRIRMRSGTSASTQYIEAYRVYPQTRTEEVAAHASAMAWKLQGADPLATRAGGGVAEFAGSAAGCDGDRRRIAPTDARAAISTCNLLNPHPDCLAEITIEYPYLQERYELFRAELKRRS